MGYPAIAALPTRESSIPSPAHPWLIYATASAGRCMPQALIEARQCEKHLGVVAFTRTRLFVCGIDSWRSPAQTKLQQLHGIVEADETYFLESHKGERDLPRPARKRGGVVAKRGLSEEQIPVLIARDRSTRTTDAVLEKADTRAVRAVLEPLVDPDAVLCADGSAIYRVFSEQVHLVHRPINLSAGIRVVDHAFHIHNVNDYDSRLKTWMARFHGIATKYLPNYLGWRRYMERFTETLTPSLLMAQAIDGDQHLTQT